MDTHIKVSDRTFEAFKEGNEKAFQFIFESFYPIILTYVFKFCKSLEEAEDIVHEAFVNLYLNRSRIENSKGLYPYLFTIAKRMTISAFRKKVSETRYQEHLKQVWQEDVDTTEQTLSNNELQKVIKKVVNELPPKQKEVYLLNKQEELSYLEISNLLDISINTVKNHLVAASKYVKIRLSDLYITPLLFLVYFCF